jgi:LPS-assembly lipoprotein
MWWPEPLRRWRHLTRVARLAVPLAVAGLTSGCFEALYATRPAVAPESVQDKFAAIEVSPIPASQGTPAQRVAVGMYNALEFDLHNGGHANAPLYRLVVQIGTSQFTAVTDPTTGRPDAQINSVNANYQLIDLATGKTVVRDNCFAHVDSDIPGSQQRFAKQRAERDAEDHAIQMVAETIRNRLASYFVAGT